MQKTITATAKRLEWQCGRCGKTLPRIAGDAERRNCPVCGAKMSPISVMESAARDKKIELKKLED